MSLCTRARVDGESTSAGRRNLSVCERYSAPGKRLPMMAGNSAAHRLPGSTAPGRPARESSPS